MCSLDRVPFLPMKMVQRGCFALLFIYHLERLLHLDAYTVVAPGAGPWIFAFLCCMLLQLGLLVSALRPQRLLSLTCLLLCSVAWDATAEIYYGADQLAFNLLLFLCFFRPVPRSKTDFFEILGVLLMIGQLSIIYLLNGWSKLQEPAWHDGSLIREQIYPGLGIVGDWLNAQLPWLAEIVGATIMLLQFSILGVLGRRTRVATALMFVAFHLAIAVTLHFLFGLVCAAIHCLLLALPWVSRTEIKQSLVSQLDEETD